MKIRRLTWRTPRGRARWTAPILVTLALVAWAARVPAALIPAVAGTRATARLRAGEVQSATAAPRCTVEAVQAAAGPGMTIGPIDDLNPDLPPVPTGVRLVPAKGAIPSHCLVTGSVVTDARTGKYGELRIRTADRVEPAIRLQRLRPLLRPGVPGPAERCA